MPGGRFPDDENTYRLFDPVRQGTCHPFRDLRILERVVYFSEIIVKMDVFIYHPDACCVFKNIPTFSLDSFAEDIDCKRQNHDDGKNNGGSGAFPTFFPQQIQGKNNGNQQQQ